MNLYEKHRPRDFEKVLGQDKAVKQIKGILARSWGARAWWISGASGTGKTTLARIIAQQGATDFYITEFRSADEFLSDDLDDIERTIRIYGAGGKSGRAFIVNEAHGLRKPIVRRLLGLLENLPSHVCFIFTTTKLGQEKLFEDDIDASPLLSRCTQITLTNQGLNGIFTEHCKRIAQDEGLDGKPIEQYKRLAQNCKNNCREMLMSIESGEMRE